MLLRTTLLVVLLGAGAAQAAEPSAGLSAATREQLAAALACVNVSMDDLAWDKRPLSDDFRLACVNETLDHPLALASRAEQAERDFGTDPLSGVVAGAAWLDTSVAPDAGPAETRASLAQVPASGRALLAAVLARVREARGLVAESRAGLAPAEREVLEKSGSRLYTDESEEPWDAAPVLAAAKKVDLQRLGGAASALARAADAVTEHQAEALADAKSWRHRRLTIDGLAVEIGGPGDDALADADVCLDPGGNDTYTRCHVVIDLGGDDTYRDCAVGERDAVLVVDVAGDDRHVGGNFAQGGAAFGASLLVDRAGNDLYEADQASQGAAFFGYGMLYDLAGNDSYRGARFVQGFGGCRGLGVLSDRAGNDTYWAGGKYSHAPLLPENFQSLSQGFGFGMRPDASGGVGVLLDSAGNDVYSAEVFGQGASYWFALGILADSAGHDKYDLYQYGQGAGIHLSPGVLMDRAGNDAYSCNNGVAQGSGHDWGVGMLWDRAGNDYYQGSGMSQGGVNANGMGIIIDEGGNDAYSGTGDKNQGDSFFSRGTFGLGVLLDMGGKDRYTHGGKDGATWTRGTVGVGRDVPDEVKP